MTGTQLVQKMISGRMGIAFFAAVVLLAAGCSNSDDHSVASAAADSKSNQAQIQAAKAAAEAEAAEEEFAKAKSAEKAAAKTAKHTSKSTGNSSWKKDTRSVASAKTKSHPDDAAVYLVQVGTFKIQDNAKKVEQKLKSVGLPAFQKKIERQNGTVLYAVRIEPTPNRMEAEKFVASAKSATGESPLILSVER